MRIHANLGGCLGEQANGGDAVAANSNIGVESGTACAVDHPGAGDQHCGALAKGAVAESRRRARGRTPDRYSTLTLWK